MSSKINSRMNSTLTTTPAYQSALAFAKDMVKRDRAGAAGDLRDIRVGSSDGTPFGKRDYGLNWSVGSPRLLRRRIAAVRGQGGGKGYGGKPAGQPKVGNGLSKMLRSFLKRMGYGHSGIPGNVSHHHG